MIIAGAGDHTDVLMFCELDVTSVVSRT